MRVLWLGAVGQPRPGLAGIGDGIDQRARQADTGRRSAADRGDHRQNFAQAQVLSAEDIAATNLAAVEGQQVTRGDVIDMHDVQPGIDVRRQAAGLRVAHDATGWGWLDVAGTDRGRRIDDYRRQIVRCHEFVDGAFGEVFRTLVVPNHIGECHRRRFTPACSVTRIAERRDAARIDNPANVRVERGVHERARAIDVRAVQLTRIAGP